VSDPASVDTCIREIIAEHGKIDNLVTSAGFTENFEAVTYPIDRMRKLWGVNVDGTYLFATAVARHLVSFHYPLGWQMPNSSKSTEETDTSE
jgi:NAD(P)-dependent dehydrogenase (short-subunit alcohol dehydrogenase family)